MFINIFNSLADHLAAVRIQITEISSDCKGGPIYLIRVRMQRFSDDHRNTYANRK